MRIGRALRTTPPPSTPASRSGQTGPDHWRSYHRRTALPVTSKRRPANVHRFAGNSPLPRLARLGRLGRGLQLLLIVPYLAQARGVDDVGDRSERTVLAECPRRLFPTGRLH